jgi:predicted cation transporter
MLIENPLHSELAFPVLECFHIVGFAIAIGTVAMLDFRLLGLAMRDQTPAEISRDTGLWTIGALVVAVFSGLLIYSTDPDKYYTNAAFLIKIGCLVSAIIFNYTIHRRVALAGASAGARKMVACVSLMLWVSVVFGGMFIAFA